MFILLAELLLPLTSLRKKCWKFKLNKKLGFVHAEWCVKREETCKWVTKKSSFVDSSIFLNCGINPRIQYSWFITSLYIFRLLCGVQNSRCFYLYPWFLIRNIQFYWERRILFGYAGCFWMACKFCLRITTGFTSIPAFWEMLQVLLVHLKFK